MRAISFDGGGVLGVGPATFLELWEWENGKPAHSMAHAFAGTSTGSILASALAFGLTAGEVVELFYKQAPRIFKPRPIWRRINSHKYDSANLRQVLSEVFGDKKLGDTKAPILITSADFRGNDEDGVTDFYTDRTHPDMSVVDAVVRSCSAPTYFAPVEKRYADGGLFANNPSMALLVELQARGVRWQDVALLSMATTGKFWEPVSLSEATLLQAKPLLQYLLSAGTARVVHRYCKGAGVGWYGRIAPEVVSPDMDDLKAMEGWSRVWESVWRSERDRVRAWHQWRG